MRGNSPKPGTTVERPGLAPVTYVKDDDPRMVAAIEKARNTTDQFIATLKNPKAMQSGFGVKVPLKYANQFEHMWVSPVLFANDQFVGTLNNQPLKVTTLKLGDEVKVGKADISDWMYVEGGKLIGGYTIRILRDNMSEIERNKFDQKLGLLID